MKRLIFLSVVLALTMFNCSNPAKEDGLIHKWIVEPRSISCSQCIDPILVEIDGKDFDLSKFGYYHNLLLTYIKDNGFEYQNDNKLLSFVDTLIYNGLYDMYSENLNVFQYISAPNLGSTDTSEWLLSLAQVGLGNSPIDTLKQKFINSLNLLYSVEAINSQEKSILVSYANDLCSGNTIDYESIINQLDTVPRRPHNGSCSNFLITLGAHSTCWWHEFYDQNNGGESNIVPFTGHAMTDLIGGALGYGTYMVNNWSHHYESDFGGNALKAGGERAIQASGLSFARYFF